MTKETDGVVAEKSQSSLTLTQKFAKATAAATGIGLAFGGVVESLFARGDFTPEQMGVFVGATVATGLSLFAATVFNEGKTLGQSLKAKKSIPIYVVFGLVGGLLGNTAVSSETAYRNFKADFAAAPVIDPAMQANVTVAERFCNTERKGQHEKKLVELNGQKYQLTCP